MTPIPDERGAQAQGSPDFIVTTGPTLTRIPVEVTDNDTSCDEIDASQTLANDLTIGGINSGRNNASCSRFSPNWSNPARPRDIRPHSPSYRTGKGADRL